MNLIMNSTAEVAAVVPISADILFTKLKPFIQTAQGFVAGYIGLPLMAVAVGSPASNADLVDLIRVPVANLAMLKFAGSSAALITDVGLVRNVTDSQKDAFEWQHNTVVTSLQAQAWEGLEGLLQYIEANLSSYPQYAESPIYLESSKYLIRSAAVFDQYYPIGGSRLVFQTIQPALREAEERRLRPVLGDKHALLLAVSIDEANAPLLNASRRALVYVTMSIALRHRLVDVTDQGVQVRGISQFSSIRFEQSADDKRLQRSIDFLDREAAELLNQVSILSKPPSTQGPGARVQGDAIVAF